jgi:histidyl-tRNA synthetase
LGGQSTVCGGGRYDSLIKDIGGPDMGACGFGLGLERLLIILEKQGNKPIYKPSCDAFVGYIGEAGLKRAVSLTYELRKKGISAECDTLGRNVKAQIRRADKLGAKYSLVIGENELVSGSARVKDMRTGEEISLKYGDIGRFILGE